MHIIILFNCELDKNHIILPLQITWIMRGAYSAKFLPHVLFYFHCIQNIYRVKPLTQNIYYEISPNEHWWILHILDAEFKSFWTYQTSVFCPQCYCILHFGFIPFRIYCRAFGSNWYIQDTALLWVNRKETDPSSRGMLWHWTLNFRKF